MNFKKLSENQIISEIMSLPGIKDPCSHFESKAKIIKYYCHTYQYKVYAVVHVSGIDQDGRFYKCLNRFKNIFLKKFISDPVSMSVYRDKIPFPDYDKYAMKWEEGNRINFNQTLYNKILKIIKEKNNGTD
ncbi:MAG: hypothetical protein ACFFDN_04855 [Candidatus Hodarchaeota archaeon]